MPEATPTVTVVVPVRDDVDGLARCLSALDRQEYPRDAVQVVVGDSASRVPLSSALAAYRGAVEVVRAERPGSYLARNVAARRARGDVLAFTDADCLPAPDWLARGITRLQGGADRVAGHVEVFARDPARPTTVELFELVFAFPQEYYVREHDYGVTANLMTWRRVFEAVGPFDEQLLSGGDVEWNQRATRAGHSLVYDRDTLVRHPARRSWGELVRKRFRTMRGSAELAAEGRLNWQPGLRRYLLPDRAQLARIRGMTHLTPRDRLRIATAVTIEDWAAAVELMRFRRDSARRRRP